MTARTRTALWVTVPLAAALLLPQLAGAQANAIVDWVGGGAVALLLKPIVVGLFLINSILNYLLRAAAAMLNHVTSGDFLAVPITQYPIVQIGWRITRDLANMAFVLVLLYLAFGIILRLPKVNAKQILPKLIGAALLINFSLVLTGFAIDISNRVMLLFLDPITKGDVAGALLTGSKLIETYGSALFSLRLSAQLSDVTGAVFTIVFTAILTGIFVVLALMFVARLIIFWQIAIMAPLAWLSAGIPIPGMNFFASWFDRLKRWLFWGPKAAFWVFLAVMSARAFQNQALQQYWAPFDLSKQSNLLAAIPNALLNAATPILQYIVIVVFLFNAINAIREGTAQELGKYLNVDAILGKLRKPYQAAWRATGVPGGVKQRWEEAKKEGGVTIAGRRIPLFPSPKARARREARVAGWLGSKRATARLTTTERREEVKETQESFNLQPNDILRDVTNNLSTAATNNQPPTMAQRAAAAQELLGRRDFFQDINARAGGGAAGNAAEQAMYRTLRSFIQSYVSP
ncbi:hypothetical protein HYW67_01085 [Candidatus Parcubacteria bacterium]|nr:hypothetical protein [Candidatus Parcubacteria bacterium]